MKRLSFVLATLLVLTICFSGCKKPVQATPAGSADPEGTDNTAIAGADDPLGGEVIAAALPPIPEKDPVRPGLLISFTGDIMAHTVNFEMEDYNAIYTAVEDLFLHDDLTFANLEFPVYEEKPMSTFPLFNVHPPFVEAAINAGMDTFSMANNHSTDKGPDGTIATYDVMTGFQEKYGIAFSGIRKDIEAPYLPTTINIKGWTIGFIAVTQWLNTYWGGDHAHYLHYQVEEDKEAFFTMLDEQTDNFDFLIMSFHGGVEYATVPDKTKIDFFEECLGHGVDIIWAHHPHVLQPWNLDRTRDGGKLLLYSAGNFISGQAWYLEAGKPNAERAYTGDGAVFQVRIQDNNGSYKIHSVTPVLLTNYKHPEKGMISRKLAEMQTDTTIPEGWRNFYKRRYTIISSHIADFSIPNILR